ncbi:uncharacterized protein TM35_000212170 [Trypanosoma theileri]|uniref:Uncharacterized protein n=1 Tax=Trypanosoma theileri TaxID=67003 RepID=A0A1X0NSN5_9TRYP|nr:uncharacterized protein TM35_000212170 [Trypanosoma theileri]ORC87611.1 hypothetical protein TM35_000212170 [Trypanosoma theileri]
MSGFARLRSDGALSIDLREVTSGPSSSNVFVRDDNNVVVPSLQQSSPHPSSEILLGNVSSSTGTPLSPRPRIPSSVNPVEFNMKERLVQEEEWRHLRECTFNPSINPRSRHLASMKTEEEEESNVLITRRHSSHKVHQKLFDDAKKQRNKLDKLRAAREAEKEREERYEMQQGYLSSHSISPRRKKRNSKEGTDNNTDNNHHRDTAGNENLEVFERLYADASCRQQAKAEEILRREEEMKRREEEEMRESGRLTLSPERRREEEEQQPSQNEEAQKKRRAERKELFARLSVPLRRREKCTTTVDEELTPQRERESRRSSVQWPLPFLHTLTLADLQRHNELVSRMSSRAVF